ncbi:hypothetical protein HN858_02910 [Candidatus Falkowbacteria bacterium]|jgi:hypothetical protein|nr:hypothetical protein [Candidatus Falkowbacteria bacterium]MBT5503401.1 hypothetical protein [Candidatus Falkowbacteria bacterium]MBT6574036.1 hypothetical protein [Candidatus Falkowbacteria bacterium]MBT7348606.1 hypothetical protein [Candidatus Falkowbacteria bacterium]MBT7500396.1 hypothetical protein [Candidatus Falkowbacteria bacterium]
MAEIITISAVLILGTLLYWLSTRKSSSQAKIGLEMIGNEALKTKDQVHVDLKISLSMSFSATTIKYGLVRLLQEVQNNTKTRIIKLLQQLSFVEVDNNFVFTDKVRTGLKPLFDSYGLEITKIKVHFVRQSK